MDLYNCSYLQLPIDTNDLSTLLEFFWSYPTFNRFRLSTFGSPERLLNLALLILYISCSQNSKTALQF
uniref:Uncharacterized protein n=1 Tax=Arundo donax TaxID=35708 RepID=A0A0A9C1H0_ARUDO